MTLKNVCVIILTGWTDQHEDKPCDGRKCGVRTKLAVVSDPSLNSAGLNLQPNVARRNSAGNANTKYIIIGTICLVLAIAVVVAAYFVIKNMK